MDIDDPTADTESQSQTVAVTFEAYEALAKVKLGEPIFILRGQDVSAPSIVREWALRFHLTRCPLVATGGNHGFQACTQPKVVSALRCADAMEKWPSRKEPD